MARKKKEPNLKAFLFNLVLVVVVASAHCRSCEPLGAVLSSNLEISVVHVKRGRPL